MRPFTTRGTDSMVLLPAALSSSCKPEGPRGRKSGNIVYIDLLQRRVSLRLIIMADVWPIRLRLYAQERNEEGNGDDP